MSGQGSMTGRVFNNRYEIGERIGVGGMAEVYSAQDNVLGRIVAVKIMLQQYADDPDFTRRFKQEAAAAANLQSPYIVNVYDWGYDDGTYYIVMEYVRGSDLKTAIQQRGAINQRKVAEIGSQVCQALAVAHQQDIIHRDIKPQNIMVQPDGNVKVMDFGIARAKNSVTDKTQTVLGTAHYISPEQAQGKELTAASDIYSLGIVLYEAATGTLPFDGPDAVSVALMQVKDFPPPPSEINPDIDPVFEDIIMTALEKDPHHRFATVGDMRQALNDYLAGRTPARNGFTSAQTSVIAPIGAAAGAGADSTQVMPVTPAASGGSHAATTSYRGASGRGTGDKDGGSSKKKGIIIAVCVIVALAIIGAIAFALMGGGEKIPVPDVTKMTVEQATTTIEDAGFQVGKVDSAYDPDTEPGQVISQDPEGGKEAPKGSKINLVVSQGTEEIDVPDVMDMSEDAAKQALTKAGFIVERQDGNSDSVKSGNVMKQDPQAGTKAVKGSKVTITISKGAAKVKVPNIVGMSYNEASSTVSGEGLSLSESGSEYSSSVPEGNVIRQDPSAGSEVDKGSTVTCVVSKGPEPAPQPTTVSVPRVVGSDEASASSSLESKGFNVVARYEASDTVASGKVISQNPSQGSSAQKGATITIVVSTGPAGDGS